VTYDPKTRAAVALYCRDEAGIIAEWLAHYYALGFTRAYVFLNGSSDGTREILEIAQDAQPDFVEIIRWSDQRADLHPRRQVAAYDRALRLARADGIDWLLAVDADEFLVHVGGDKIDALLRAVDNRAAVALYWAFYGSASHVFQPAGLVTQNFLQRGDERFGPSRFFKSLVRPQYTQGCMSAHAFSLDAQHFPYVNCRNELIRFSDDQEKMLSQVVFSPWRINHYFVQSQEHWRKKLRRSTHAVGFSERSEETFRQYDVNQVFDVRALAYTDRIRFALRSLGLDEGALNALRGLQNANAERIA